MARLEGPRVSAVTLFFSLKKKKKLGNTPLPIAASDRLAMCYLISYKFMALWAEKHIHGPSLCVLAALCCGVAAGGFSHYRLDAGLAGSSPCSCSGRSFLDRVPTTLRCTLIPFSDPTPCSPLVHVSSALGGACDHSCGPIMITPA